MTCILMAGKTFGLRLIAVARAAILARPLGRIPGAILVLGLFLNWVAGLVLQMLLGLLLKLVLGLLLNLILSRVAILIAGLILQLLL